MIDFILLILNENDIFCLLNVNLFCLIVFLKYMLNVTVYDDM